MKLSSVLVSVVAFVAIFNVRLFAQETEKATFAGGCFWCLEGPFEKVSGVVDATPGYTGGQTANPTYEEVSSGTTGHFEAVQVTFRPDQVSYERLLDIFWRQIDPTDSDGQFADRGTQYRTAIFFHNAEQKRAAQRSKENLDAAKKFNKPIVTEVLPASVFYPAEPYHQDYYKKKPVQYGLYRIGSGRDNYLQRTWQEKA